MEGVTGHDEIAIGRAIATLVQTATFGVAANSYAAHCNRNFDEVAVTAANDKSGGLYIFEYRQQPAGSSIQDAKLPRRSEEAVRCAIDVVADPGTDDQSGWLVRVRGENCELLCAIDAHEAEATRQQG
ncbi:MAG: hypothetical protein E5X60_06185, partial [Mesorhizobium sp.]